MRYIFSKSIDHPADECYECRESFRGARGILGRKCMRLTLDVPWTSEGDQMRESESPSMQVPG